MRIHSGACCSKWPKVVVPTTMTTVDITDNTPKILDYATAEASRRPHHHRLRRCLPSVPRQAVGGLEARRPRPGRGIDAVRSIRDEIRGRFEQLLNARTAAQPGLTASAGEVRSWRCHRPCRRR